MINNDATWNWKLKNEKEKADGIRERWTQKKKKDKRSKSIIFLSRRNFTLIYLLNSTESRGKLEQTKKDRDVAKKWTKKYERVGARVPCFYNKR